MSKTAICICSRLNSFDSTDEEGSKQGQGRGRLAKEVDAKGTQTTSRGLAGLASVCESGDAKPSTSGE